MDQQVVGGGETKAVKTKPSYKHIPHSQKPAHLVAKRNARERRRVQAVNQAFYRLRKCVPIENRNKRVSKVKTLQRAIDYIRKLERILADDEEEGSLQGAGNNSLSCNNDGSQQVVSSELEAAQKVQQRKEERRLKRVANNGDSSMSTRVAKNVRKTGKATLQQDSATLSRVNNQSMNEEHYLTVINSNLHQQVPPNNCHPPAANLYQQQQHQQQQEAILRDPSIYHSNLNYYTSHHSPAIQAATEQYCNSYELNPASGSVEQAYQLSSSSYLPATTGGYYTAPATSPSPHIGGPASVSTYAPADSTTGSLYSLERPVAATDSSLEWCKRLESVATAKQQQLSAASVGSLPAQEPTKQQLPGGGPTLQSPASSSSSSTTATTTTTTTTTADSPSAGDNSSTTATARRPPAALLQHPRHPVQQQQQPPHHQQQQQVNASSNDYLAYAAEARAVHLSFAAINDNNNYQQPVHLRHQLDSGAGRKSALEQQHHHHHHHTSPQSADHHHQVVGLQRGHSANSLHHAPLYQQHPQNQQHPPTTTTNMLHRLHQQQQPLAFANNQHVQAAHLSAAAPHLGPAPPLHHHHHHHSTTSTLTIQEYTS